jgi:hypothetical protein
VALVIGVLSAVLTMPLDVVWCQGLSGHSALELAWAVCCTPPEGDGGCGASSESAAPKSDELSLVAAALPCTDLWLGGPVARASSLYIPQNGLHAMPAHVAGAAVSYEPARPRGTRATPLLRQVRELISSTVLTV